MFRHLPILLIIFASTSAHAEQGFFEQLLDSLKSKAATTTSEPAGEPADSIASEPLALQPTTTTPSQPEALSREPPPFRVCAAAAARSAHRVAARLFKKYGTIFRGGACRAS